MDDDVKLLILELGRLLDHSVVVVLPFFMCLALTQLLARLAPRLGLLDLPTDRKRHESATPLVGGIAIFAAMAISLVILSLSVSNLFLIALTLALVVLGLLDDRYDLSAWIRLLVQVGITLSMVHFAGVSISSLGNLFGNGQIVLSPLYGTILTVMFAIGVINAINMVDGVDGLAGSLLLISFASLAFVSVGSAQFLTAKALFICTGTLLAFLCFNARVFVAKAEVFMGDAGSMALGFMMLWFFVRLTQEPSAVLSPVAAGWIFGLPLLDTVVIIVKRLREKRSPLSAGRDHFHHDLLDGGLSVNATVLTLTFLHALMALAGVWLNSHQQFESLFFGGFVTLVLFDFLFRGQLIARLHKVTGQRSDRAT